MKEDIQPTLHVPVLFDEVVKMLSLAPGNIVVDATLGGGGHAQALLQEVLASGKVIAIDTDEQAILRFQERAKKDPEIKEALDHKNMILVKGNYSALRNILEEAGITKVNAILADLGFSSDQIEESARGMSFQKDGPLDMRLDQSTGDTAEEIVNEYEESELEKIFREYGEEKESHRIARAIGEGRKVKRIVSTLELKSLIEEVYPKKLRYSLRIHPATKVFQALRITVNKELEHLEQFLEQAVEALESGGRLAVITFHSGEDRVVKQFFKKQAENCVCPPEFPICQCGGESKVKILTRKPLEAGPEEIEKNPRSRSAKLRVVEKI